MQWLEKNFVLKSILIAFQQKMYISPIVPWTCDSEWQCPGTETLVAWTGNISLASSMVHGMLCGGWLGVCLSVRGLICSLTGLLAKLRITSHTAGGVGSCYSGNFLEYLSLQLHSFTGALAQTVKCAGFPLSPTPVETALIPPHTLQAMGKIDNSMFSVL